MVVWTPPSYPHSSRIINDCRLVIRTIFSTYLSYWYPNSLSPEYKSYTINYRPSLARGKAASYSQTCSIKTSPSDHMILKFRLRHLWAKTNWNIYDRNMDGLLSNISPFFSPRNSLLSSINRIGTKKSHRYCSPDLYPSNQDCLMVDTKSNYLKEKIYSVKV
jgi:hypothetical protein